MPLDLDENPNAVTYRSPRRLRETLQERKDAIIEISDEDSDEEILQAAPSPRPGPDPGPELGRSVIPIPSDSEADTTDSTDSDLKIMDRPPNKRSRPTGESESDSPGSPSRANGKRRATPANPRAMMGAALGQDRPNLQFPPRPQPTEDPMDMFWPEDLNDLNDEPEPKAKGPKKKKEDKPAPYYVDTQLEVKMYRGPGYESFPVALGTIEGHKEICQKWDEDTIVKAERKINMLQNARVNSYVVHGTDSESNDDSVDERREAIEKKCLESVIQVFPDIDRAFVTMKIRATSVLHQAPRQDPLADDVDDHTDEDYEIQSLDAPAVAGRIITEILDMPSYPKAPSSKRRIPEKKPAEDGSGITITWNRSLPKDGMYRRDATILLAKHFLHVPTHFIDQQVKAKNSIFNAFIAIHDLENRYYELQPRPYPRRKLSRNGIEKKYMLKHQDLRIADEYAHRVNEFQAARQHVAREALKDAAKKAKDESEEVNLAEHKKSGALMECQCCYDTETPLNRTVPCTAEVPHYFCFGCVEGLADTQVGMLQYEMLCMDASGCCAKLSREDVGRAIPIITFDRLEFNQQQAEIAAAKIEGLEQCPSCDYQAICGDLLEEPLFNCQNSECCVVSCRKCRKLNHVPKTCEEAAKDRIQSLRHMIEEARSEAIIRTCRHCQAKIIKDFGCNKMNCTRCGSIFCYNCNADISALGNNAYTHFDPTRCILYDTPNVDRHEGEADKAEKEAIAKAKAEDSELNEEDLRIALSTSGPVITRPQHLMNLLNHPGANLILRDQNQAAARLNQRQQRAQMLQAQVAQLEALRARPEINAALNNLRGPEERNGANGGVNLDARMQELRRLHQDLNRRHAEALNRHVQPPMPRQTAGMIQPPTMAPIPPPNMGITFPAVMLPQPPLQYVPQFQNDGFADMAMNFMHDPPIGLDMQRVQPMMEELLNPDARAQQLQPSGLLEYPRFQDNNGNPTTAAHFAALQQHNFQVQFREARLRAMQPFAGAPVNYHPNVPIPLDGVGAQPPPGALPRAPNPPFQFLEFPGDNVPGGARGTDRQN